jgi:GGDEF domain-containing protein
MPLQGPIVVVADTEAADIVEALRAAGAFPIVAVGWADADSAIAKVDPEALVLAAACPDPAPISALAERLSTRTGPFIPVVARAREDGDVILADALSIAATVPANRLADRLASAQRIRTLHSTVLRRARTLVSHGEAPPELPANDPLDEASVLLAGRGPSYPMLSVILGERVGVIGALSVENAARALQARDIDGVVIGEGFGPRLVDALLTVMAENVRFRDLPIAMLAGHPGSIARFAEHLPNLERLSEGPQHLAERFLPYVRLHAFGERLRRMLKSLDAKGMIDPDTGLLGQEAFWRDLNRAVDDAERRGVGLSMARFSFNNSDRRSGLDAARLLSRLMRQVDFACREADNSIFAVFTDTDLRAAHVVARRLASVLKNTTMAPDRKRVGIEAAVTLATLRPNDSVNSLIARVVGKAGAGAI